VLSYPILVGEGLLHDQDLWTRLIKARTCIVITDDQVAPLYLEAFSCDSIVFPAGESHKNFETLQEILAQLTAKHFPRDGLIIALGGGVVGDVAGFAAAIYQRGVAFIQVPTTSLAMADSSVGGKTAVNVGDAKNNVGAFHQPEAVVMDLASLKSLNDREYAAGLAEVVKHGLIQDAEFFNWLLANKEAIKARDATVLKNMIERSCAIKAKIVAQDEKEQGLRMLLNFGHTFGHAVESYSRYQDFKHGEAVSIGMICALHFSKRPEAEIEQVTHLLEFFGLPTTLPKSYDHETLRALMAHDKKKRSGLLNLILLKQIGEAYIQKEELCKIHF